MSAFLDVHHHFLYGVDDGAATKLEMQQMLVAAHKDGSRVIIATPHVSPGLRPVSFDQLNERIREARAFSQAYGLDLEVYAGAELLYTYHAQRFLAERRIPTMAGSDKILIEFSPDVTYQQIEDAVLNVLRAGYLPILAHIERYPCLMRAGRRLRAMKREYDVFFQVNADSVLHGRDFLTNRTVKRAIQEGLVDFIASDAHNTHRRVSNMQMAYERLETVFGVECADRLTCNHRSIEWFRNL